MLVRGPTEAIFFSTVRIETTGPSGIGTGTAFGFSYEQDGKSWPFLVTNKHVVRGAVTGRFFFTQANGDQPSLGQRVEAIIENFEGQWFGHHSPDVDVTVMPCGPLLNQAAREGKPVFFPSLPHKLVPDESALADLDAVEEILFVGYPNGVFDRVNLLPVIRRGVTASPPQVDYEGRPVFLIDASVFPGSSGSPVLICKQGVISTRQGINFGGSRVLFLGVVAEVLIASQDNRVRFVSIPTEPTPFVTNYQMIDLGVVYKSRTVLETVIEWLRASGAIQPGTPTMDNYTTSWTCPVSRPGT
jgi:hypothetical protein